LHTKRADACETDRFTILAINVLSPVFRMPYQPGRPLLFASAVNYSGNSRRTLFHARQNNGSVSESRIVHGVIPLIFLNSLTYLRVSIAPPPPLPYFAVPLVRISTSVVAAHLQGGDVMWLMLCNNRYTFLSVTYIRAHGALILTRILTLIYSWIRICDRIHQSTRA